MRQVLFSFVLLGAAFLPVLSSAAVAPVRKLTCTALRDESGAPTYAFELTRKSNQLYEARYLNLPGNESSPPVVVASISDLKCRFYSKNRFYLQCERLGASVESVYIYETKLRLIDDKLQAEGSREYRAVGVDVPNSYQSYRFGSADRCVLN